MVLHLRRRTSVTYKALVIGSGRVVIRGSGRRSRPVLDGSRRPNPASPGVIYALNNQSSAADAGLARASPKELIRVERGARVTGGVHADGKNATIG